MSRDIRRHPIPARLWREIEPGDAYYAVLQDVKRGVGFSALSDHPRTALRTVLEQAGVRNPPPGWRLAIWGQDRRRLKHANESDTRGWLILDEQRPASVEPRAEGVA